MASAYRFGEAGHPIHHTFLMPPIAGTASYYEGYDADDQMNAYIGAQAQITGFFDSFKRRLGGVVGGFHQGVDKT